jgi:hypothetical protein
MVNKRFWLGILVMVLVFGIVTVSCDLNPEYTWEFVNNSSYEVQVFNTNFDPSEFTLATSVRRSFTNSNTSVSMLYTPANTVAVNGNTTSRGGTFTFSNR